MAGKARIHGAPSDPLAGRLFAMGDASDGSFDNNLNTGVRSSPVQVGSLSDWKLGGAGYNLTYGLRAGGFWAMGYITPINQGWGTRSSPVQVGSDVGWTRLAASANPADLYVFGGGIRDGKLFMWGFNDWGQLGVGDRVNRSSPVQVGSGTDWEWVAVGAKQAFGIRSGKLFGWGFNIYGMMGIAFATVNGYSSPVQIGSDTDWTQVSTLANGVHAIRGGKLFGWGSNTVGEIGNGSVPDASDHISPIQLGSAEDWTAVSHGEGACLALRDPGKLFGWGPNTYGQLGLGDRTDRSSPVQAGSETDWSAVTHGYLCSAGLRAGKLFCWGANNYGQLGLGDANNRSSPVQVGSASSWLSVSAGRGHIVAVRA